MSHRIVVPQESAGGGRHRRTSPLIQCLDELRRVGAALNVRCQLLRQRINRIGGMPRSPIRIGQSQQGGGGELRKLPSIGVTRLLGRVCCQAHPGDESEHAEAGGRPFRTPHSELRTRKPHRVRHDLPSEPEAKQQEDGEADRYPIEAKLWLGCAGRRGWNWLSAQQLRQELRGPSL